MKILYVAGMSLEESSLYHLWALERLGHRITSFNTLPRNLTELSANPALAGHP